MPLCVSILLTFILWTKKARRAFVCFHTLCLPELRVFVCFHTFDGSEELVQGEIFNDNKPKRNINMSVDISISIWREEKAMKQLSQKTTHESAFFCQVMMNPEKRK